MPEHDRSDEQTPSESSYAQAPEELVAVVYDQLRALAARYMSGERADHTLRPTALVHEAYLRLAGKDLQIQDRPHFLALAASVMRRVLVDHARRSGRQKRGSGAVLVALDDVAHPPAEGGLMLTDLDEALQRLAEFDQRKSRIVELIYFGGLTREEAAAALGISTVTVQRDLRLAKAWLETQLSADSTS